VEFITGQANDVLTVPNSALRYRPAPEELAAAGLPATPARDTTRRRGAGGDPPAGAPGTAGAQGAGQGAGQGGGGRRGGGRTGAGPGVLYTVDSEGRLTPVRVRTGLSDGQRTQVSGEGVAAGLKVIIGSSGGTASSAAAAAPSANPLAPQRGGGGPGGGGRGF
jgi:HlyD family secretion protein